MNKKSEEISAGLAIVNRIIEVNGRIMRIEPGSGKVPCMFFVALKEIENKGDTNGANEQNKRENRK